MREPQITVRWAADPMDLRAAVAIREQVFCREQGVPREEELDGLDEQALHLIALAPGAARAQASQQLASRAVGTLRLLLGDDQAKIGRVAVERDFRGLGIASQMIAVALDEARRRGARRARLASQLGATGLYERAGFAIESAEPFEEAGIAHVWMGLALADEAADR